MTASSNVTVREYRALAQLRYAIRKFLAFSASAARSCDIEPQQHQLLLALKGLPAQKRPTIGVIAERLQLRHHSTVELVKRSIARGFLQRSTGDEDHREVLLRITPSGERLLETLSVTHRKELRSAAPELLDALSEVVGARSTRSMSGTPRRATA